MIFPLRALLAVVLAIAAGCAIVTPNSVTIGEAESNVIQRMGQPTHRYQDGKDQLLEYAYGPWGQQTYMARIGPDGTVLSFEQVLTTKKFATIKLDQFTKSGVLHTVGAPSDTSYLALTDLEVWSYPYRENDVWNSVMHIHFDRTGIVRKMLNGPDLRFDPDGRFPFGMLRH